MQIKQTLHSERVAHALMSNPKTAERISKLPEKSQSNFYFNDSAYQIRKALTTKGVITVKIAERRSLLKMAFDGISKFFK